MHLQSTYNAQIKKLLTYAYPPKNASKYSPKIFFEYPKDFRGLIRPLKFFGGDYQCLEFIPKVQKEFTYRFHYGLQGRLFQKNEKKLFGGVNLTPPPGKGGVKNLQILALYAWNMTTCKSFIGNFSKVYKEIHRFDHSKTNHFFMICNRIKI